jgi:hypothetical protein
MRSSTILLKPGIIVSSDETLDEFTSCEFIIYSIFLHFIKQKYAPYLATGHRLLTIFLVVRCQRFKKANRLGSYEARKL